MTTDPMEAAETKTGLQSALEHGFTERQYRAAKAIEYRIFGPYEWQHQGDRAATMVVAICQALKDEIEAHHEATLANTDAGELVKRINAQEVTLSDAGLLIEVADLITALVGDNEILQAAVDKNQSDGIEGRAWRKRAEAAEAQCQDALAETEKLMAEYDQLQARVAELAEQVVTFCGLWAVHYAEDHGFEHGHLHPNHYDILEKAGARMDDFTRTALEPDELTS